MWDRTGHLAELERHGRDVRQAVFLSDLFHALDDVEDNAQLVHYLLFLAARLILNSRLIMYGRMAFILSSQAYILLHSGLSRCRWMASNAHFVVQTPQPMHLFGSTMLAPQLRQRADSF